MAFGILCVRRLQRVILGRGQRLLYLRAVPRPEALHAKSDAASVIAGSFHASAHGLQFEIEVCMLAPRGRARALQQVLRECARAPFSGLEGAP